MTTQESSRGESFIKFFDDHWIERPIMERFERAAAAYPYKIAVDDGNVRLTYSELRYAVHHLAHRIESVTPPGRAVGIAIPNTAFFPCATLACLATGRVCIPIDLSYPEERNKLIFRDADLATLIVIGGTDGLPVYRASLAHLDILASISAKEKRSFAFAPANLPAIVLYTSGSTGQPKGICNDQRAISQRVTQFTKTCQLNDADRFILLSSPATIAGIRDTFAALLNGGTLYIADPNTIGMTEILRVLRDKQITICYAVPALFRTLVMLTDAKKACSHLRVLRLGGDIVLNSDITLWQHLLGDSCQLLIGYGSTEVPTTFQWFVPNDWRTRQSRVPVGYQQSGVSIELIDDDGKQVKAGEIGELVVKSSFLALGIWQNGRLAVGDFLSSHDDKPVRILHTGDLVRLQKTGLAEFVGRKDRVVKIRGKRADLVEIEDVLRGCENINDAAVTWSGDKSDPTLIAYLVSSMPNVPSLAEKLNSAVTTGLPEYMRPSQFRLVNTIPRLPSGKPDIQALKKSEDKLLHREYMRGEELLEEAPLPNQVKAAVEKAWTEVLNRDSFRANLPWDQAGGDSLKALRLLFFIEEKLDVRLPLDALDSTSTPRDLIAAVGKLCKNTIVPLAPDQEDIRPLVFLMPGHSGDEPNLVRFRVALQEKLRFRLARYPSWREMCRTGAEFDRLVDAVVAQVIETFEEKDCLLAGYSFGGFVACEVARRLTESGRRVAFVGLIDSRRAYLATPQENIGRLRSLYVKPRRFIIQVLMDNSTFLLRGLGNLALLLPSRAAFWFHDRLIRHLRSHALRKNETKPLDIALTLFRSDENSSLITGYWAGLCEKLQVVTIGGNHISMLKPPYRALLCERFLQAVQRVVIEQIRWMM